MRISNARNSRANGASMTHEQGERPVLAMTPHSTRIKVNCRERQSHAPGSTEVTIPFSAAGFSSAELSSTSWPRQTCRMARRTILPL